MSKNTQRRAAARAKQRKNRIILLSALAAVLLVAILLGVILSRPDQPDNGGSGATNGTTNGTAGETHDATNGESNSGSSGEQSGGNTNTDVEISDIEDTDIILNNSLTITEIGSYTGIFMEDGSDEPLQRILMITVKNSGSRTIQYAQIQLTDGKNTANFSLTTLPPGESIVLLEQSRMSYADGKNLTEATIDNVALFPEEPTLCEDQLKIQGLNGVLNITNVSGKDIAGDVVIYYKNASSDMLYGGITYRIVISGGLKDGEIRQISASHFTEAGSRVMWVTVG